MRLLYYIGCFFLLVGCAGEVTEESLTTLNGYWEIKQVVFPDGATKDYEASTTVDFIELKNKKGFRKKVQPQFDGTFDTSNDAEPFKIVKVENDLYLHYKNELSEWKEQLVKINEDGFVVVNEEGIRYEYKRFVPLKIENQ